MNPCFYLHYPPNFDALTSNIVKDERKQFYPFAAVMAYDRIIYHKRPEAVITSQRIKKCNDPCRKHCNKPTPVIMAVIEEPVISVF